MVGGTALVVLAVMSGGCSEAAHVSRALPTASIAHTRRNPTGPTLRPHRNESPSRLGFPRLIRASPYGPTATTGGRAVLPPGTDVPDSVVRSRTSLEDGQLAALAGCDEGELSGACYPVISQANSRWVVDGPQFSTGTADGAAYTDRLTLASDGTLLFWGHGGNIVKLTTDNGRHWYAADWPDAIYSVHAKGRRLTVRALGNQIPRDDQSGLFATRLYVSMDDGRTWQRSQSRSPVPY
jgi:hypothetical protein